VASEQGNEDEDRALRFDSDRRGTLDRADAPVPARRGVIGAADRGLATGSDCGA